MKKFEELFLNKLKITTQLSSLTNLEERILALQKVKSLSSTSVAESQNRDRPSTSKEIVGHPAHFRIKVEDKNSKTSSKWVCVKSAFSRKLLSCFCHADIWQFLATVVLVEKTQNVQFVRQTSGKKYNPTSCNQHVVENFFVVLTWTFST